jgi:hypothetical protein
MGLHVQQDLEIMVNINVLALLLTVHPLLKIMDKEFVFLLHNHAQIITVIMVLENAL